MYEVIRSERLLFIRHSFDLDDLPVNDPET